MLQPAAIAMLRKIRGSRMSAFLGMEIRPPIEINATWEGSRRTTTCEPGEAPGSRQSPKRGLAVNSWVGGKGRDR
jgi:hypothetical protein